MSAVEIHHEARAELRDAVEFYNRQVEGLGAALITEIERTVQRIADDPELGIQLWGYYRRVLVWRFPYAVIYRPRNGKLIIVAIAHQHRRPGYWRRRK